MKKGFTIKQTADVLGTTTTKVWYDIKKTGKLSGDMAECGKCFMVSYDSVMNMIKNIEDKNNKIILKKDLILKNIK